MTDKNEELLVGQPVTAENIDGQLLKTLVEIKQIMQQLYEGPGSQPSILIVLLETGEISQQQLTQKLGIKPGSASEVLSKLENAHLIERKASPKDKRTCLISLSEQGRKKAQEAYALRKSRHEAMFASLDEKQKEELLFLLEILETDWLERFSKEPCKRGKNHGKNQ